MMSAELIRSAKESEVLPQVEGVLEVMGQDNLEPLNWRSSLFDWESRWLTANTRLWEQDIRRNRGMLNWELALWGLGGVLLRGGEREIALGAGLYAALPAQTARLDELVERRNLALQRGEAGVVGQLGEVVNELAGTLETQIEQTTDPVWKVLVASQGWEVLGGESWEKLTGEAVLELYGALPVDLDLAKLDEKGGWDKHKKSYQLRKQDLKWLGAVVERAGRLGRPDLVKELEDSLAKAMRENGWRDLSMPSITLFNFGRGAAGSVGRVANRWVSEMESELGELPIHLHGELVRRAVSAGEWEKVWRLVRGVDKLEVGLWQTLLGEALATGEERQLLQMWQEMQRIFPYPNLRVIEDWWLAWGVTAGNAYTRKREERISILRRREVSELVGEGMVDFALDGLIKGLEDGGSAELPELTDSVCRRVSVRVSEGRVSRFESESRLRHLLRLKQISVMDRRLSRQDVVGVAMEKIWKVS